MTEKAKWIWMPHPAHFICARDCKFHLATNVGNHIVSTVGEYLPDAPVREIYAQSRGFVLEGKGDARLADYIKKLGYEEIGYQRKYETMVFTSGPSTVTDSEWQCCPWVVADYSELDVRGYNTASAAYNGHLELCDKWSA